MSLFLENFQPFSPNISPAAFPLLLGFRLQIGAEIIDTAVNSPQLLDGVCVFSLCLSSGNFY